MIKDILIKSALCCLCVHLSSHELGSQEILRHSCDITEMYADDWGQISFRDINKDVYSYNNNGELKSEETYSDPAEHTGYSWRCPPNELIEILDHEIIDSIAWLVSDKVVMSDCSDIKYEFTSGLNDIVNFDKRVLISSKLTGLWVFQEDGFRQLYYPGVEFPKDIKKIEYQDGILWILRSNGSLLAFDTNKLSLTGVAFDVKAFAVDKWNVVNYASGKALLRYNALHNNKGPELAVSEMYLNDRRINSNYNDQQKVFKQGDRLRLILETFYTPDKKDIAYQITMDNSAWRNCEDEIELILGEAGLRRISIRVGVGGVRYSLPLILDLKVEQNFFMTLWPYLFGLLIVMISISWISQLKARAKFKQVLKDRQKLKLEIELMKSEQRLKQAQMNPHLLYNALNALKGLVVLGETRKAADGIGQFAHLMRSMLEKMEVECIAIEEEIEFLRSYLKLEQNIRPFDFSFDISSDLKEIEIPVLMIQPFVENALIHGLSRYIADRSVSIHISRESYYIKVLIQDRGRGAKETNEPIKKHKSKAAALFEERCMKMDRFNREHYLEYTKAHTPDGRSQTSCILYVPINRV